MSVAVTGELWKVFLVGFNPHALKRDKLTAFLDQNPLFFNWITLLPGQVFVVSQWHAQMLADALRTQFRGEFIFVSEISPLTSDGWLPKEIWDFIREPKTAKSLS